MVGGLTATNGPEVLLFGRITGTGTWFSKARRNVALGRRVSPGGAETLALIRDSVGAGRGAIDCHTCCPIACCTQRGGKQIGGEGEEERGVHF
jgi:hypothetical protein